MVLRGYKIPSVSASTGVNCHNLHEVKGTIANYVSLKDLAQLYLTKSKKSLKILHSHTQVYTGIAKQLLQVSLKQH